MKYKKLQKVLLVLLLSFFCVQTSAQALWLWTKESNKWENPKDVVQDTPLKQLKYAKELYAKDLGEKALKEFRKLVKRYPKSIQAPDAQFYIGEILYKQDDLYQSYKEYQKIIDIYPFSERSADVVVRQFQIADDMLEGRVKTSKWKKALLGTEAQVVEIYRQIIKNAPYSEFAPEAQFKIGLFLQRKSQYQEARDEFEKTLHNYPNTSWSQKAKYQIALTDAERSTAAQYDQKVTRVAVEGFKDVVEEFPQTELSDDAREQIALLKDKEAENAFVVAQFYEKQKNYKSARIYYNDVVDLYGTSKWAVKSLERLQALQGF